MNKVIRLFDLWNQRGVNYCVRGKFKHLPETLNGGDIDILIRREDFERALAIIRELKFRFYPFTQPNLFYFGFDKEVGLIHLDILVGNNFPQVKKYKNFYIPTDEKVIPNRKKLLEKFKTGILRRLYYLFNGNVFVFEGPDGSGKSTNLKNVFDAIKRINRGNEIVHFATAFNKDGSKPSSFKRMYSRIYSIIRVWKNKFFGRLTFTDRYIFLTFRKNKLLKKLVRFFSPNPDIVFIMKAGVGEIRKRKEGQRDQLSEKLINELYKVYDEVPTKKKVYVDTMKPYEDNLELMINEILRVVLRNP
jgi:thymidylate kinase